MVRPADNVRLIFDPLPDGEGSLVLDLDGELILLRRSNSHEFRRILRFASDTPQRVAIVNGSALWMFREAYFWDDDRLTQDEVQRKIAWSLPAG